ncbi:hypothetical protein PG993_011191 [Apiospora rasikravindrae]|uniref:Uncharacterized protein n=1 Tax=Apiospora rasikravindrae TaxID=990691 RepID=A0ABR1SDH7_9PEZI
MHASLFEQLSQLIPHVGECLTLPPDYTATHTSLLQPRNGVLHVTRALASLGNILHGHHRALVVVPRVRPRPVETLLSHNLKADAGRRGPVALLHVHMLHVHMLQVPHKPAPLQRSRLLHGADGADAVVRDPQGFGVLSAAPRPLRRLICVQGKDAGREIATAPSWSWLGLRGAIEQAVGQPYGPLRSESADCRPRRPGPLGTGDVEMVKHEDMPRPFKLEALGELRALRVFRDSFAVSPP